MTEIALAVPTPVTPLATLLASTTTPPELGAYHGVLTPQQLDAPEKEIAALANGTAVHDLGWRRRVAVRGEDRFRWLSGMVTNTVNDLAPNGGAWNLVLNAQGRIQGDLYAWRDGEQLELEIAADQFERLMAHLDRFIIMDDVELVPLSGEVAIGLTGPLADEVLGRAGLPVLPEPLLNIRVEWNGLYVRIVREYGVLAAHYVLWVQAAGLSKLWKFLRAAGAASVGSASLDGFRIAEGIPIYGVDIVEKDLPQETSQTRALHFTKGCYLGQEIVERIRSRGNVHRHLRQLELIGPVPPSGTALSLGDGGAAGQITSAAELQFAAGNRTFALGMIRGEAEVRDLPLAYTFGNGSGTARILAGSPKF